MSPPVETFEYDDLTEVYRKEQRAKNVTEVRKDLYAAIREKLTELRKETEKEFASNQFSTKAKLAANQLTKFREKADQVFEFRMEKILAMTLRAALGNRVDTARLTSEETELFTQVSSLLKEYHTTLLEIEVGARSSHLESASESLEIQEPHLEYSETVDDAEDNGYTDDVEDSATTDEDDDYARDDDVEPIPSDPDIHIDSDIIILRITEDLPPFAGPDRNYHLRKEDVVCLPSAIAKALIARKKAIPIKISKF
ncbi:MAG: hypothetical protein GX369_00730 [Euryarchaeota archaeon]|nr:hypothetical protein [Euryarchaeota archaeon]